MKILISTEYYYHPLGGAEKILSQLVDAMLARGDSVTICSFEKDSTLVTRDGLTHINFVPFGPLDYSISALRSRGNFSGFNVAFSQHYYHFSSLFATLVCRKNKTPLVLKPIGIYRGNGLLRDLAYGVVDRTQGKFVLKNASRIVPTTRYEAQLLERKGISKERITVIRSGIYPMQKPTDQEIETFRSKYHLDVNDGVILFVGRIEKSKGVDVLLKAVLSLKTHFVHVKCLLVGPVDNGFKTAYSKDFSKLEDSLILTGSISGRDLASAYYCSNVFCLPSRSELASLSLREAQSVGLPVIASNVGGNPEFVSDLETGFLIPPNDPGVLAQRIEQLLTDPTLARAVGEAGRKSSGPQTIESYVRQTLDTIDSVAKHDQIL